MSFLKKVGGLVLGVVGGVIGFIAGGPAGAAIGFSIGMGIGTAAQMQAMKTKVPDTSSATGARLNANIDPDANLKIAFGKTALGTDLRYWENFGPESSYVDQVIAAAGHKIHSFGKLFLDDEEITFSGDAATGAYEGALSKQDRLVGVSGTALSVGAGALWMASASMTGIAHYALKVRWSQEKFPRGIPTRITREGEGALVYDPRRDSTVPGGEGDHRADDQDTWEYAPLDSNGQPIGRNPALQILWYEIGWRVQNPVTGEWILRCGRGRPLDDIDFGAFVTAANDCEEQEYYSDCLLSTGDAHETNIAVLEAACAGKLMDNGGRIGLRIRTDTTGDVVQAFGDGDVLDTDAADWIPRLPLSQCWNQGIGSFVDPRALYKLVPLPTVRDPAYEAEDGFKRNGPTFRFDAVQDPDQAQKLIRLELNISRYQGVFTAPFNWRAKKVRIWDCVTLSFSRLGFENKIFRVLDKKTDPMGAIWLLLREDDPSIYTGGTVNPVPAPTPGAGYDARVVTAPDANDWVVTPTYREGGGAKIPILTVDSPETPPNIVATHVWQKLEPSGSWIYVGRFTAGAPINLDLTYLLPGQQYSIRLVYENAFGVRSAPTDLGPYDAPDEWIVPTAGFAQNVSEEVLEQLEEWAEELIEAEAEARDLADDLLAEGIGIAQQAGYRNWFRDPLNALGNMDGYGSNALATYMLTLSGYRAMGVERSSGSSGAEVILYLPGRYPIKPGARGQAAAEIEETVNVGALELRAYYYDDAGAATSPAYHTVATGASGRLAGFFGLAGTDTGAIPEGTAFCRIAVRAQATASGAARFAVSHIVGAFAGMADTAPVDFVDPRDEQVVRQLDYAKVEIGNAMQLRGLSWEAGEARSSITRLDTVQQDQAASLLALQTSYGEVSANASFRMQTGGTPSTGFTARIGMQARVSSAAIWRDAGIWLDVSQSASRAVISADQVVVEGGGVVAAIFQAGTTFLNMANIANASITNAMIANLSASKLSAGDIDTNEITIRSGATGARTVQSGGLTEYYDASNNLVMRDGIIGGLPRREILNGSGQVIVREGRWT